MECLCVEEKYSTCKGKPKTALQYEIFGKTDHRCLPNLAGMEVKVKLNNSRKRAKEDVPVSAHTIYNEDLSDIYAKGCSMVTEIPKYDNVKTRLCQERRNVLGTEQNAEYGLKIVFPEELLRLSHKSSLIRIDHIYNSGKKVLVFAGVECEY